MNLYNAHVEFDKMHKENKTGFNLNVKDERELFSVACGELLNYLQKKGQKLKSVPTFRLGADTLKVPTFNNLKEKVKETFLLYNLKYKHREWYRFRYLMVSVLATDTTENTLLTEDEQNSFLYGYVSGKYICHKNLTLNKK